MRMDEKELKIFDQLTRIRLKAAYAIAVLVMGLITFGLFVYFLFKTNTLGIISTVVLDSIFVTIGWQTIIKHYFKN